MLGFMPRPIRGKFASVSTCSSFLETMIMSLFTAESMYVT